MPKSHLQLNHIRKLDQAPTPSHLQARILDTLHQEQLKTAHRRNDISLVIWLAAGLSFIASLTILCINLVQSDFGSIMQTMLLNYQDISAQSFWLAMLENIPFGSLALTFITATWLTLSTPKKPFTNLRHNIRLHLFS